MCGCHVTIPCRNRALGEAHRDEILKVRPQAKVVLMDIDLASLASVKKFCDEYSQQGWYVELKPALSSVCTEYTFSCQLFSYYFSCTGYTCNKHAWKARISCITFSILKKNIIGDRVSRVKILKRIKIDAKGDGDYSKQTLKFR